MTGRITTSLFIPRTRTSSCSRSICLRCIERPQGRDQLNAAMDEINKEERKRHEVLIDLPDAIAKAFLSPTVTDGGFTGDGENPSYVADVEYNKNGKRC